MIFQDFLASGYLLYLALLFCFLLIVVYRGSRRQNLSTEFALDLSLITMVFGMIGARAFHILWESPELYTGDQWPRIFQFWLGGFVYDGGALCAFGAGVIFTLLRSQSIRVWSDFFAPLAALGYSLGRISCWIAGCCYGRTCPYPWAIGGLHPTQLYASAWEFVVFLILLKMRKSTHSLFLIWVALHSIGRLIMEHYRDDFRGALVLGFSVSSFLSLVFLIASVAMLLGMAKSSRSKA